MMRTGIIRFVIVSFFMFIYHPETLVASGGDDHTHGEEEAPKAAVGATYFSSESTSDKYELLLRYEPLQVGERSVLTLFVSDYASNKAIDLSSIAVSVPEDASLKFSIQQSDQGIYTIEGVFPQAKVYSFMVELNSAAGPDLMVVPEIHAGRTLVVEPPHEHGFFSSNWMILVGAILVLALGVAGGMLFQRRSTLKGRSVIGLLLFSVYSLWPIRQIVAHGEESHDLIAVASAATNTIQVPKETQFLFDVLTMPLERGGFAESTKLFGTIVPSSNGRASVVAPQSGQVLGLSVAVGQQVKAGEQLAVLEQTVDAGTQVSLEADKNELRAELEAAQKEVDRLLSIQDIAAKKDLDEANARLQKADTNLRLLSGNSGRVLVVRAPISGVVGSFSLSKGATVYSGQTLFTLTDLKQVYVEAQVYDKDLARVEQSERFTIECVNDQHKSSQVRLLSMAQEINPSNQSQRVLFTLDNPLNEFKIGEFVNIRAFAAGQNNELSLPNAAITEINGKPVVFVKQSAEQFAPAYVQLGENNGTHTRVLKGVEEGQRIVVNSTYQLKMIHLNK